MVRDGLLRSLACLMLLVASAGAAAAQNQIGTVGAVNPATVGAPPQTAARQLTIADRVVRDERISAGPEGLAQLMLLDQTTLTVGPNSEIVLDRFVFDPDADRGELALSLTRGALRFIGGRISKSSDAQLRAPGGIVAVRGGIVTVSSDRKTTAVTLFAGDSARVTAGSETITLSRPGAVAVIEGADGPNPTVRYAGLLDGPGAAAILWSLRSPGDGGRRAATAMGDTLLAPAAGGSGAAPVSTRGQLASVVDAGAIRREAREFDVLAQTTIFSDPRRMGASGGGGFENVGGDGVVRGQLVWRDRSDLDLHLVLPGGAGTVFFGNRQVSFNGGGALAELDADNLGGVINVQPDLRVENIRVSGEAVPVGAYRFFVRGFRVPSDIGASPFTLTVTGDGGATTRVVTGAVGDRRDSPIVEVRPVRPGGGS